MSEPDHANMSCELEDSGPPKVIGTKAYRNSIGNHAKFAQQKQKQKTFVQPVHTDRSIMNDLSSLHNCCGKCYENGCVLHHFTGGDANSVDYTAAIGYVKECRAKLRNKNAAEVDQFVLALFKQCITKTVVDSAGKTTYVMQYMLPGEYKVCKVAFAKVYGISVYHLEKCSAATKRSLDGNCTSSKVRAWTDGKIHNFTYRESEDLLRENLGFVEEKMARASLSPLADRQQFATVWLERHFAKYGDCSPDSNMVRLMVLAKRTLWVEYKKDMDAISQEIVTEARFSELWAVLFPRYMNRTWCNIPGKCDTCYEIDQLRRTSQDAEVHKRLREAHHLHRGGMFMLERQEYKRRASRAMTRENQLNPTVLSMIIDGMDQNHCKVPYMGSQQVFDDPAKQSLTGVKEHGGGVTFYRTLDTITKGANLTIYIILDRLEKFRTTHGKYPEVLYLQVDGGCENANSHVLSMLELLVVKRMCREVYFTRLPTGHTHEDIDAVFAVIWEACCYGPCLSLDDYKEKIEAAFKASTLKATVQDVMVIPDFVAFITPCQDKKLARLHKELHTQHQWKFEAVVPDQWFPLGVKTMYRAYSSDRVVEFRKLNAMQCLTAIGRATGLEPVTVYCQWYPSRSCDPLRPGKTILCYPNPHMH
jgi:hypothetical protein